MPSRLWEFYAVMLVLGGLFVLLRMWKQQRRNAVAAEIDSWGPNDDVYAEDALPYGPGWFDHDEDMPDDERKAEIEWMNQWIA